MTCVFAPPVANMAVGSREPDALNRALTMR